MSKKNSKDYLAQGLLVSVLGSSLSKGSDNVKIIVYSGFIIFCIVNLIKVIRERNSSVGVIAITSLTVLLIYEVSEILTKKFSDQYIAIYDSKISIVINIMITLTTVISFGVYGYTYVEEGNRKAWLKQLKIVSIIILVLMCIMGVLYIISP